MKQLTIRGFGEELADCIRRLADQDRISLNQAVLRLLRVGAGLGQPGRDAKTTGGSLEHLIGTWTDEEADEMLNALQDWERIDRAMWK